MRMYSLLNRRADSIESFQFETSMKSSNLSVETSSEMFKNTNIYSMNYHQIWWAHGYERSSLIIKAFPNSFTNRAINVRHIRIGNVQFNWYFMKIRLAALCIFRYGHLFDSCFWFWFCYSFVCLFFLQIIILLTGSNDASTADLYRHQFCIKIISRTRFNIYRKLWNTFFHFVVFFKFQ